MNIILLIYLYNFLIELDVIVRKYIKQPTFNIFGWAVSSVGRASRLHRGGQRFESFTAHQIMGGVAQLVRAIACHAIGRGFESLHSRHKFIANRYQHLISKINVTLTVLYFSSKDYI